MKNLGVFVAIEGVDFSGTSTNTRLLHDNIKKFSQYQDVLTTHEPWKSEEIRRELKENSCAYSHGEKMAELYILDREKHQEGIIIPVTVMEGIVISDRFHMSTYAYQNIQGVPIEVIKKLHQHHTIKNPDLTFFIDVGIDEIKKRMQRSKKTLDKFEKNKDFQEKIISKYRELAQGDFYNELGEVITINGEKSKKEISNEIFNIFMDKFSNRIDSGKY